MALKLQGLRLVISNWLAIPFTCSLFIADRFILFMIVGIAVSTVSSSSRHPHPRGSRRRRRCNRLPVVAGGVVVVIASVADGADVRRRQD